MPPSLEFTGERFIPGTEGEIAHEHWHRYVFAQRHVAGRRVLDVASGEGYGSALLAEVADAVTGVDIDGQAVAHARATYPDRTNLAFVEGSATALPIPDASVDAIISFETVEHLPAADQPRMIAEFARVLAPHGILVLSSPNRTEYSDARNYSNPFHLHELDRDELARLLDPAFAARRWYRQRRYLGSALWAEEQGEGVETFSADGHTAQVADPPAALYFVVIAARNQASLPVAGPRLSLLADRDDREWKRIDAQAREVLRQDALVKERDQALDRQTAHIHHLETLVVQHGRVIAERDAQLAASVMAREAVEREREVARGDAARASDEASQFREKAAALDAERDRLERAIHAQERIIAYRQSARWWVKLPWLRVRLWWHRISNSR